MKNIIDVVSSAFSVLCVGYLSYTLVVCVYCKFWRDDIPWFTKEDYYKVSNVFFKIWVVGIVVVFMNWMVQ